MSNSTDQKAIEANSSDDQAEAVEIVEDPLLVPEPVSWLNGLPLFILSSYDQSKIDEVIGMIRETYSIFYILANQRVDIYTENKTNKTKTVTGHTLNPRLFRVVSNFVGHSITTVESTTPVTALDIKNVETRAMYGLPKMPMQLIKDVDTFFRHIHATLKTEAIVIFSYDPEFLESDDPTQGWGILVPQQQNTAASCDYDATTVVDDKDDHVIIVGTAHSHPMMNAYCSGTDKKDQATMDGIHITYGWTGPDTKHYIEMQMGGQAWTLQPEQLFDGWNPDPEPDEKVLGWSEKVATKKPATNTSYSGGSKTAVGAGTKSYGSYFSKTSSDHNGVPIGAPFDGKDVIIVTNFGPWEDDKGVYMTCPVCYAAVTQEARTNQMRCTKCENFIMPPGMTFEDLVDHRSNKGYPIDMLTDVDGVAPKKTVWGWNRYKKDGSQRTLHNYVQILKGTKEEATKVLPPSFGKEDDEKMTSGE